MLSGIFWAGIFCHSSPVKYSEMLEKVGVQFEINKHELVVTAVLSCVTFSSSPQLHGP